jgi:large subunit ribosomal protein L5
MSLAKNLNVQYKEQIVSNLYKTFNYTNVHQVPKLVKIQINRGLGMDAQNSSILKKSIDEFRMISGQQPIVTKARKSIAGFKIREEMNLGVTVTLRGKKMFAFFEKLIHLVFPQIRDFRGLSPKGFDRNGNYNFGLTDQLIFPEVSYESIDKTRGLNITIVTTAKTKEEGIALLREFGFPLIKDK